MLPDGYFQIAGRQKDMVIRGGENIFPKEVEDVLFQHPSISDVHICGVPDERMGEELCAWIKRAESGDGTLREEDVKEWMKGKVPHSSHESHLL